MTASPTWSTKSPLSIGCFYVAGYLCFGAACVLIYQWILWLRSGTWTPHDMGQILLWAGWQHPPVSGWIGADDVIARVWQTIGECPISLAFSIAAVAIALLGFVQNSIAFRGTRLRDAH